MTSRLILIEDNGNQWGATSLERRATCHPIIQEIGDRTLEISPIDLTWLCGHRSEHEQNAAYAGGYSGVEWPDSKHNATPSLALDLAPWDPTLPERIDWNDTEKWAMIAGYMLSAAYQLGYGGIFRSGSDWDRDFRFTHDERGRLRDFGHGEIDI